ncbi:preprotein translocase subunit SecA [Rhizosphaericola mali]|uniref:Protein translocase subunit SecA n=1 Tax=Rhizosphaericola mali TaxID=2545455 RepID=A0A5P2G1L1_9BACT|nr:preprotein translocase subunit SecA [Rhizosphaericola mali]QES89057.1 preprotein translocase subunit SecA [Rhizosphaericola mali]
MLGFLSKLLGGNKSEKDVKKIQPIVDKINEYYQQYQSLNNDELRGKTVEFRSRISDYLKDIDGNINAKKDEAENLPETEIEQKDTLYQEIDTLKKDRDEKLEEILNEILPEAFAVVKETAHRLKDNDELESTATELDRQLEAHKKGYIRIDGDKSYFSHTWTAGGGTVTWNMVHYDVQLIGGAVLHQGKISEMATGEGKTLVSTLPAYLNALAGQGVHLVTVNDYLARRDSEWNGPLFEWLGITVDCIDKHQPNTPARRKAYAADITYGTNNEFGFDYLRDNMVQNPEEMVQRKHHYAMIDEVDSVLIDDARTPLIISGPVSRDTSTQQFFDLRPRVEQLVEAQRRIVNQSLIEAKKLIAEGKDDPKEGGFALYKAHRGLPKTGALIKYLSEAGNRQKLQKAENFYLADQQKQMHLIDEGLFFYIDEKNNSVELTDKGIAALTKAGEDPHFFVMPDIGTILSNIAKETDTTAEEKLQQKEVALNDYSTKTDRIHGVHQLLKAYTLFEKDNEYVVIDGQVKIVDEQTGRIMDGRRYSDGLHQALEAKENVKIEAASQTYATVTLQNYFRMYHKLAGMTGTAETEAAELWDIYKLDVVNIPTNINISRKDEHDLIFKTKREKYGAVIDEIVELTKAGRPVLVGTTSVEVSELLSRMLRQKQIPHKVLNAKQHAHEAQVVAEAGKAGAVTIATNMAGRGTDIKLGEGVKEAGGLAILGTERHESRRVDRQLRGRAGRQGDPGSSQFYVSLEDDLMRMFGSERIAKVMDFAGYKEGEVIQHSMITKSIERAQKKVEENNFGIRKRLLEYDDVMNKQRTVIYTKRNHALFGDRLALDLDGAFYNIAEGIASSYKETNDYDGFKLDLIVSYGVDSAITKEEFESSNIQKLAEKVYLEGYNHYVKVKDAIASQVLPVFQNIATNQAGQIQNVVVPFTDGKKGIQVLANLNKTLETNGTELVKSLEKTITLAIIDDAWKEHLRAMDDLKQSVQTAYYEQKDPLVIYKQEAYGLFAQLNAEINKEVVEFLSHVEIPGEQNNNPQQPQAPMQVLEEGHRKRTDLSKTTSNKADVIANGQEYGANEKDVYQQPTEILDEPKQEPVVAEPKIGRNDPCPCGSGKKYKNCHGKDL